MPPRKRATTTQAGPSKGGKKSKKAPTPEPDSEAESASVSGGSRGPGSSNDEGNHHNHDDLENRPPYEYYCLQRPFFDVEKENEDKEEDEQLDEDALGEQYNKDLDSEDHVAGKPAADHPDHKWISMWQSWKKYSDLRRLAFYTCPDAFGMYIYNDFNGYGLQELIQNTLINFDKEFSKRNRNDERLNEMWCITSAMIHCLLQEELQPWFMIDDGELFLATIEMIGLMFLAMLNELDQANLLKPDSRIKDLGLVLSCFLEWSDVWEDHGNSKVDFPDEVVAYIKKAGTDLENAGVYGTKEKLDSIEEGREISPSGNAKADRWAWKRKFNAFKKSREITFKEEYNILKMSRKERAGYAFDKKDPFKDLSDKDLREGVIMPA